MRVVASHVLDGMALATVSPSAHPAPESGNAFYRVVIANNAVPQGNAIAGYPAAFTGPDHPLTARMARPAEILGLHADCGTCGGWNDLGLCNLRIWNEHLDLTLGNWPRYVHSPDPGFECVDVNSLAPPTVEVLGGGGAPGVHATWIVGYRAVNVLVERLLRVHGVDLVDSRIESTVRIMNLGSAPIRIGLREGMVLRISGPPTRTIPSGTTTVLFHVGLHPPDPADEPFLDHETEWVRPTFRMWEANPEGTPSTDLRYYSVAGAIGGPATLSPPPTPPDVLQQTTLNALPGLDPPGAADQCFEWHPPDPPRSVWDLYQMAMISYWGPDDAQAIALDPGQEVSFTQYLVAFDDYPISAQAGDPIEVDCQGPQTTVTLSGEARTIVPTAGQIFYRWSSTDPRIVFDDPESATTDATIAGVGSFPVTLTVAVGAFEASDTTTVTVVDAQPPSFRRLDVTPTRLWPPNHEMWPVDVAADFADDCDPAPTLRLVAVTSSEQDDIRRGGDGNTSGDIAGADIGTDDRHALLRAERLGRGVGRTYTLTYEAIDWAGNIATSSVEVRVDHDQRSRRPRAPRRP